MTVELVKAIKEAEIKAESVLREAQQQARQMVKEAEEKGGIIFTDAVSAAEAKAKELISKAEAEAKAEAEPLVQNQHDQIADLRNKAGQKMSEAVAVLKDKVVKIDADH